MAESMLYVKVDVNYDDDPKIIEAGEKAELLYIRGLILAKRTLSDGFIADVQLARTGLTTVKQRAAALCRVGLWQRDDDRNGYWIVAWLKHNRPATEVAAIREKRRAAGAKGGKASGQARAEANGKQSASAHAEADTKQPGNPEGEVEEEAEEIPPLPPPSGGEPHSSAITILNPRTTGTSPRQTGTNPRAAGTKQRALQAAEQYGRSRHLLDRRDAAADLENKFPPGDERDAAWHGWHQATNQEASG